MFSNLKQHEQAPDLLCGDQIYVRVTPLTLGNFIDEDGRDGKTSAYWRSVTHEFQYSLLGTTPVQQRVVVFQAKNINFKLPLRMAEKDDGTFARGHMGSPEAYHEWLKHLFPDTFSTAIMQAPLSNVKVISQENFKVNGNSTGGRLVGRTKQAHMIRETLDYADSTLMGKGKNGPAYMLELVKVGFPTGGVDIFPRPVKKEKEKSSVPKQSRKLSADGSDDEITNSPATPARIPERSKKAKLEPPADYMDTSGDDAKIGSRICIEYESRLKIYYS